MTKQARFLVLRGGAIGDFIVTLPALHALRSRWPDAYIELVGYPHVAQLAMCGGLVNKVASLDQAGIARFFALKPMFTEEQVEYIRSFDVILSYLHDPGGSVQENLSLAGAKQVIYGSPIVAGSHAVDHLMKPLETLAIYGTQEIPQLTVDDDVRNRGRDVLKNFSVERAVAIHPGSGSPKKNWPLENFIAVARKFPGRAIFIAGEADAELEQRLRDDASDLPVLSGRTLLDVAGVLSASALYVGNDSGITHLAAAVGVPVIALFGSSDALRWSPRGPSVRTIRAPRGDLSSLTVDEVLELLKNFVL